MWGDSDGSAGPLLPQWGASERTPSCQPQPGLPTALQALGSEPAEGSFLSLCSLLSLSVPSLLLKIFFLIGKIEKVGKIIEELESSSIAGGGECKVLQLLWKTVWQLLKKLNIALP